LLLCYRIVLCSLLQVVAAYCTTSATFVYMGLKLIPAISNAT
jgi:hypothetical protein